jgi:hypothetical protein
MRYVVLGLGISGRVHRAPERCRQLSLQAQRLVDSASSLHSALEVEMWRVRTPLTKLSPPMGPIVPLHPFSDGEMSRVPIEQGILRHGSVRKFAHIPIGLEQLSTMRDRTTPGIPADLLDTQGVELHDVYLIVNAVHQQLITRAVSKLGTKLDFVR